MRIVHDIEAEAQVTTSGQPHAKRVTAEQSVSFRVSVTIGVDAPSALVPKEEIHIEGNGRHVLRALEEAASQVRRLGELFAERGEVSPDWNERQDTEAELEAAKESGRQHMRKLLTEAAAAKRATMHSVEVNGTERAGRWIEDRNKYLMKKAKKR